MPPAMVGPAMPARKRPQTHAVDGAVTGIGQSVYLKETKSSEFFLHKVTTELVQNFGNFQTCFSVIMFIIITHFNQIKQRLHEQYVTVYLYIYIIIIN